MILFRTSRFFCFLQPFHTKTLIFEIRGVQNGAKMAPKMLRKSSFCAGGLREGLREPFRRPLFGSFWTLVHPKKALELNTFALRNQKSVSCTSGEQIFTFSRTCCAKPSGGHTPQLRNTHLFGLHRDDDDFGLIGTLSFGALVLWFCTPIALDPGMGRFAPPFGAFWPVFAPPKALSWPPESVQEGLGTSF